MTSSESEGQGGPTRKRLRSNADDGGAKETGGKKARGRPRVDTQDATAADRRRTQIRLAQRAYRQRKETTISSLKQQSTRLHAIIEQMNKTFLRLNDATVKSGLLQLNPGLARESKCAAETFAGLVKTAGEMEVVGEDGDGVDGEVQRKGKAASPSQDLSIGWGYTAVPEPSEKPPSPPLPIETQPDNFFNNNMHQSHFSTSLLPRRQLTVGQIFDQPRNSSSMYPGRPTSPTPPASLPFGMINMLSHSYAAPNPQIFSVHIPTPQVSPPTTRLNTPLQLPPLTKSPKPDFTYSHEEATFARRLTRAALETGFHLLSNANIRPSALNYVFKLSLPYLTLSQLSARFKMLLARSIHEDLDFWETPFIHLGGAGTHYPRRDASGNPIERKNNWTIRQIGPLEKRMARLESVADGRWEEVGDIDLTHFEGEWFDAYDVQGHLEECWGVRFKGRGSFVECLVEEDGEPELTHSSTGSGSSTASSASITPPTNVDNLPDAPFGLDMSYNNGQTCTSSNQDFAKFANVDALDQTLGLDLAPGYDYGFSGVDMSLGMDMMGTQEVETLPVVRQRRKKVAWLEVNRLVDEIIKHGVCLGRAPGFRRRDVDSAVKKALVSPY